MPRHADDTRRRGVAGWLIATGVAVVVAAASLIAYFLFLRSDAGSGTVATGCTGSATIEVAAGASTDAVNAAATAFNATQPQARGTCLTVHVTATASAVVAQGLASNWANQAAPQPALWIADSTADVDAVEAGAPSIVAGHTDTVLASSPVVLTVKSDDAAGFPTGFAWRDLLTATDPDGGVRLTGDRPLKTVLGDPRSDLATAFAIESLLGASGTGASAVTESTVTSAAADLSTLAGRSARSSEVSGLLGDLAGGSTSFTVVPALEAHVAAFDQKSGNGALKAVYPTGPTVSAELLPIALTASWLDQTEVEGASVFLSYLRSDAGLDALRAAGWRTPGGSAPAAGDGIDRSVSVTAQPASPASVPAAIAKALGLS